MAEYLVSVFIYLIIDFLNAILIFIAEKYQKKNQKNSAKVSKVFWCKRVEPGYTECYFGSNDFACIFQHFADPKIILNENVTLYALTEQEAVFVDTGDVTLMKAQPGWLYLFQQDSSNKLITMPLDVFMEMSEKIDLPSCPVIHIANHTRCGGTLMSRIFQSMPRALVLAEPQALTCVAFFSTQKTFSPKKISQLYISTLKCLFKQATLQKLDLVCVKSWVPEVFILQLMFEATPFIKHIYLYRNPLTFVKSWEKLFALNQYPMMPVRLLKSRCNLNPVLCRSPLFRDENIRKMSWYEIWALHWIRSYAGFMDVYRKNYPISTVRFEDFIANPDQTISQIFKLAGIKDSLLPDAKSVLKLDSQKDSMYTTRSTKKLRSDLFTPITKELKEKVDRLCDLFDVPSFWSDEIIELPNKLH